MVDPLSLKTNTDVTFLEEQTAFDSTRFDSTINPNYFYKSNVWYLEYSIKYYLAKSA